MLAAGAIIAIICFACGVSGLIWLALNFPRERVTGEPNGTRFDPMQDENGDVPNLPDWWR